MKTVAPRVKIPPPIFKRLSRERPDAHLLAAEDWMEAMRFRPDDYMDKFKHTLQHSAREWYHGLDLDQFAEVGMNLLDTLVGTFPLKAEISSICMKDGKHFHLTQIQMTLKNTYGMFAKQQNSLDMMMVQF